MHVSSSVNLKESCLKLRYVYIMECSSQGKSFKVALCIYHQVFISRKVVSSCGMCIYHKVFISRKIVESCGMYIS